jgi:chromate transporter
VRAAGDAEHLEDGAMRLEECTIRQVVLYFLRLGAVGFGGPIALAGYMQRDLVEERRWISEQDYKEGLALAQLAPGPLAAQLAIYLGWVRGRVLGATLVGFAFVLPSFLMVLALSALYLRFEGLTWMQGLFYGVGAAVIAIIARSAVKLVRMTLAKDWLLWTLFGVSAAVTAWTESEIVWVFVASGVIAMLVKAPPPLLTRKSSTGKGSAALGLLPGGMLPWWMLSGLHGAAAISTLWTIAWYFTEAGAFVFGSGLAIVPFLHGGVVERFHWLSNRQFLDAVAVAMITPGPVVITVAFIGYLVAGPLGASVAALGTFLPCYLFTVIPAPHFRRLSKNQSIKAFVDGVTAAATGAIAGAALVLGRRAIFDLPTAVLCAATLLVIFKVKKVPEPLVILAAGVVGLTVHR